MTTCFRDGAFHDHDDVFHHHDGVASMRLLIAYRYDRHNAIYSAWMTFDHHYER